jgi:hypothetical protein
VKGAAAVAIACVAVLALGACSGDDDDAASPTSAKASTTVAPSTTTSAPAGSTTTASTVPDTVASGGCNGALGFAEAATAWASANADPTLEFGVEQFRRAAADPSWARATLVPDDRSRFDPATLVGHCDANAWTIVDAGTSEVGCGPAVPAAVRGDLGLECP